MSARRGAAPRADLPILRPAGRTGGGGGIHAPANNGNDNGVRCGEKNHWNFGMFLCQRCSIAQRLNRVITVSKPSALHCGPVSGAR